jgi:L-alanine-DL-glutamate epimerase-like enolase superfamily enzyme
MLEYEIESWPLKEAFSFAGHTVKALEAIHVTLKRGGQSGHGEGLTPIVFPITIADMEAEISAAAHAIAQGRDMAEVCAAMRAGPARNALDCALWDLRAKESGKSIWQLAELPEGPAAIEVDQTIGLGTPADMARQARASTHRVLKIKMDGNAIAPRLRAVREACPDSELIIDANQGWSIDMLKDHADLMVALDIKMVEQPVTPADDHQLEGLDFPIPIFADESCHVSADVERLKSMYHGVNIKLDKTGGLTEALALARAARRAGMGVMVGCMSGTSLSMAPAYVIASLSDWADLDGPLQLQGDRVPAMRYDRGLLSHPASALWG